MAAVHGPAGPVTIGGAVFGPAGALASRTTYGVTDSIFVATLFFVK